MDRPNDQYSVLVPPLRSPLFDVSGEGSITAVWKRHLIAVASKAGRSMVWRGAWIKASTYAINDVVSDSGIWCALAENTNQKPGSDDGTIWSRITGGGGGGSILLQTNGVDNATQDILNLVAGTNITLTDDGAGNVTIDSTGGGGGAFGFEFLVNGIVIDEGFQVNA